MKILVDTHTHSVASTHAYSTVTELALAAKNKNLEGFALTDHGPELPDSPHDWHFENIITLPRKINDVYVFRGIEANILDYNGTLDIPKAALKRMDIVIASFHTPCIPPSDNIEKNTKSMLLAIENPFVDIVGHMGNGNYPLKYEEVVKAVKKHNKLIEINNHSFGFRKGSKENCTLIARLCIEHNCPIVVSSDAHFSSEVGEFEKSIELLKGINFPESLIMNTTADKLIKYLKTRKDINI